MNSSGETGENMALVKGDFWVMLLSPILVVAAMSCNPVSLEVNALRTRRAKK